MAMDPGTMQQMLMQQLAQGGSQSAGGGAAGPQMQGQTNPMGAAAQLAQKAMLIKSLQGQSATPLQTHQANAMLPGTNQMMAQAPLPQPPMPPMQATPQVAPPFAQPIPGYS